LYTVKQISREMEESLETASFVRMMEPPSDRSICEPLPFIAVFQSAPGELIYSPEELKKILMARHGFAEGIPEIPDSALFAVPSEFAHDASFPQCGVVKSG
jgi:hypothetical protein